MIRNDSIDVPQTVEPDNRIGAKFTLRQPWRNDIEKGFRPARVWMGWTPEALHVRAELTDDEILTAATANNQRMWRLGDVFEMFVMVEGRKDYIELHVTPNNKRMHARSPGVGGNARLGDAPKTFEEMLVSPVGFSSQVSQKKGGWSVSATIPANVLALNGIEPGTRLRVAFARYDAATGREPVLSTTANSPVLSFHRPDEWNAVVLR